MQSTNSRVARPPMPVRLTEKHRQVIDRLVSDGIYKTRSETMRAALLLLAEKHGLIPNHPRPRRR